GAEIKERPEWPAGPAVYPADGKAMVAWHTEGLTLFDNTGAAPKPVGAPLLKKVGTTAFEPITLSRDGKYLLSRMVIGEQAVNTDFQLWEIDWAKATAVRRKDFSKHGHVAALSPSGSWLVTENPKQRPNVLELIDLAKSTLG